MKRRELVYLNEVFNGRLTGYYSPNHTNELSVITIHQTETWITRELLQNKYENCRVFFILFLYVKQPFYCLQYFFFLLIHFPRFIMINKLTILIKAPPPSFFFIFSFSFFWGVLTKTVTFFFSVAVLNLCKLRVFGSNLLFNYLSIKLFRIRLHFFFP